MTPLSPTSTSLTLTRIPRSKLALLVEFYHHLLKPLPLELHPQLPPQRPLRRLLHLQVPLPALTQVSMAPDDVFFRAAFYSLQMLCLCLL